MMFWFLMIQCFLLQSNVTDTKKIAELINWFKFHALPRYRVFLIGGVPSGWRELTMDSRENEEWRSVYQSFDGIHPWHVGRWASIVGFESYYQNIIAADAALCEELGILYMPTMCEYLTASVEPSRPLCKYVLNR